MNVILPLVVVGHSELGRVLRELKAIDSFLRQSEIRQPGTATNMPRFSKALEQFVDSYKVNLLDMDQRSKFIASADLIKSRAPTIHISFAAEPSAIFIGKLLSWLRTNIDPNLLLHVGLQPDIAAGCTVRTKNKYFDMSIRKDFAAHRQNLIDLIKADVTDSAVQEVVA